MLGVFSCGLIPHSPKGSTCFKLLISGWRPNKPLSHGWGEEVPPGQPTHYSLARFGGQAALLEPKEVDFCVDGPCWVTVGCPWHTALQGWAPTTNFARGTFMTCRALCCSSHPQSYHKDHARSPCHPQQDLSLHGDTVLVGQDTAKPTPEHVLAAPAPGSGCTLSQERETWAPAAAASHVPNERCFSPFHYTGFLIKTERAFFFRK